MLDNRYMSRVREERTELTREKILRLAARPQGFSVTLQYRYDWLRARCQKLIQAGELKRVRHRDKGRILYRATTPAGAERDDGCS